MKQVILVLSVVLIAVTAVANHPESKSANENTAGINFHEGNWAEAVELAKKENKLIFLDVYATWCGPCKKLKANTFTNSEVGDFYNTNFINVAVDGEKGEGIELAGKFGIKAYPGLLFIDANENIVSKSRGYKNPSQFVKLGEKVISK